MIDEHMLGTRDGVIYSVFVCICVVGKKGGDVLTLE